MVKTRLARDIGAIAASEIYRDFVLHLLARHLGSCDSRTLVFSPANQEKAFQHILPSAWQLVPQTDGDLGERMRAYFEYQFLMAERSDRLRDPSNSKVIVIGADCPQLNAPLIELALEALDDVDVVLGPSSDGGYYLIGMRQRCFDVFSNIDWSTSKVLDQTIEQMNQQQIDFVLLDLQTDIDERDDLSNLEIELQARDQEGLLDMLDAQLLMRIKQTRDPVSSKSGHHG